MHAAVPDNLTATERRPTYMVVGWTAPPSPFSGSYRLTYGPFNGTVNTVVVTTTSYNITGLQPFIPYIVIVRATNDPVQEFGPPLGEVFSTLPEATVLQLEAVLFINVPQVGTGSSPIVGMAILAPPRLRQELLR